MPEARTVFSVTFEPASTVVGLAVNEDIEGAISPVVVSAVTVYDFLTSALWLF